MKKTVFLIALLACCTVKAQKINGLITNSSNYQRAPYGFVTELPMAEPQTVGSYYLADEWLTGNIYLTDKTMLEGLKFRYNIKEGVLEIKNGNDIKILNGRRVGFFEYVGNGNLNDGVYVNSWGYKSEGVSLTGFFKVIYHGKYDLFLKTDLKVINATYNAALDVGDRDNKIVKSEHYFLAKENNVMKIESNKKRFLKDVRNFSGDDLEGFMHENKLGLKDENDLTSIVKRLDSI